MPRTKKGTPPAYRRHTSGQARVTVRDPSAPGGRRDILLGPWNSPESKAEYRRVLAELETTSGTAPPQAGPQSNDLTINELLDSYYWPFAEKHYGTGPRGELSNMRDAVRFLRELYPHHLAREFDSLAPEALQEHLACNGKLSHSTINARINRIRRIFKWAVRKKLVPATVLAEIETVPGLQRGRSTASESDGIAPVPIEVVKKTLPYLPRPVAAMVQLQLLSGCRAGEVVLLRGLDLTMQGDLWKYRPMKHKTAWRGHNRIIDLGPRAQNILREFLRPSLEEFLFRPADATEAFQAKRREQRKTKRTPSELARTRKRCPKRKPGERYTVVNYRQAIIRGCRRAGLHEWCPLQLRHARADEVRVLFGIEGSMAHLGHKRVETTQIYTEKNEQLAERIARELG
jgi:integrase